MSKIENGRMGVFPIHAVGNGVDEEINLVRGYQRNDQKYITRDVHPREDLDQIWIHHRLIIIELRDER